MKWPSSQNICLVGSFLIHAGLAGLLTLGGEKSLLIGSIKGSAPAATVAFDLVKQVKPSPAKKTKKKESLKTKLFDGPSAVVLKKKPKKQGKRLKPIPAKVANRPKAKVTREGANKPQGLIGFDLRNIRGNLSADLQGYFFGIRSDIERRKKYPKIAKRLRQSGRVVLRFEIDRRGVIQNVSVSEPSQFKTLNESAKKLVANLNGTYPLPDEIQAEKIEIKLPVSYQL